MKSLLTSHATQAIQDNLKSMIHSLQIQQTGCSLITNEIKTVHLPTAALWSFSPTEVSQKDTSDVVFGSYLCTGQNR